MWQLQLSCGCGLLCLYDLLKYFGIFLVDSNNSAMWSGLLVEMDSCKFLVQCGYFFVSVAVISVMKGIRALLLIKEVFSRADGIWLSKFGLHLPHVELLQSLLDEGHYMHVWGLC